MFPIAGQTAGPNGLTFFVDTHGWPTGVVGLKKIKFKNLKKIKFFFPRATPGLSASFFFIKLEIFP